MIIFKPFQDLYINIKKSDIKLFTILDIISNYLNQIINNINAVYYASANSSVTLVVPTGTLYILVFDTVIKDNNGIYNLGTGAFTAKKEGWYIAIGQVELSPSAAGNYRYIDIIVNGGNPSRAAATTYFDAVINPYIQVSLPIYLKVGDYIQFRTYQNSGGNLNAATAWGSLTYIGS